MLGIPFAAPIKPPKVIKDINVIAGVGTGAGAGGAAAPAGVTAAYDSSPGQFVAAKKFCYFAATTPAAGREVCRFVMRPQPMEFDRADLFDMSAGVANTNPDLLTLVADEHLYFRGSGQAGKPLWHHKDAEFTTGVHPLVQQVALGSHVTHTITAVAGALLVAAFLPAAPVGSPNGRLALVTVSSPITVAKSADFTGPNHSAADLVDCGLAEELATSPGAGFAVYRNVASAPATAVCLKWSSGVLVAQTIQPAGGTFTAAIEQLTPIGRSVFLFEDNGSNGSKVYRFNGSTTAPVTDAGSPIQDARLAFAFDGCLWFVRGAVAGPHALWRCPQTSWDAVAVPWLPGVAAPNVITSLAEHLEAAASSGDPTTPAEPEPHLYVLGMAAGSTQTALWRVALDDAGTGSYEPYLGSVVAAATPSFDPRHLVSLVLPASRSLAFLAADTQAAGSPWSVVLATEDKDDGDPTTNPTFTYSPYPVAGLGNAATLDSMAPFVQWGLTAPKDGFLLFRGQHATDGLHAWRVYVPQ